MSDKLSNAKNLYMVGIRDGQLQKAVSQYTGALYKQHSTGVKDGAEGFIEFFEPFIKHNKERDIRIIRTIEDGQYVFVHVYQSLNHGESEWVTTDFFDTDDKDKIIEHWDVISQYSDQTPSGHTSIDGPTDICDLDKTAQNKDVVRRLIEDVLMGKSQDKISQYISSAHYVQHNAQVPDGIEPFKRLALAKNKPLIYDEIVLLLGQGNFVATLCKVRLNDEPFAQVDIFRLEDGLIVEHWDNAEPVPPKDQWANSGKF